MSPPPTSIDGTDITGATIDGQDVDEITIDGQTVFSPGADIPASVTHRWPINEIGSPLFDSVGNENVQLVNSPTFNSGNFIGGLILNFDGFEEYGESSAQIPAGSMTSIVTIDFSSDINDIQAVQNFGPSTSGGNGRLLRFRGDIGTNTIQFLVSNGSSAFSVNATLSTGIQRVAGILDTSASEIRLVVDGVVQNTSPITGSFSGKPSPAEHYLGRRVDSNVRFFGGRIDEPMVASEAFTSSQLTDDFNRQPWS
jgi:hypothetical protein